MKITQSIPALLAGLLLLIISAIDATAATFVVTNTNDSGAGSLRQAVLDANAATTADTIMFDQVVFSTPQTITLASVLSLSQGSQSIDILTIVGPGPNLLTINGNNVTRHFSIAAGDTISISGMTLTGGNGSNGGAISTGGITTVSNIVFHHNTSNSGACIYSAGNGTTNGILSISNCQFTDNTTTGTNINGDGGSALEAHSGKTTITGSSMTGGTTRGGGGAIRNNGIMSISNTTISNNTSGGAGNSDGGGGINSTGQITLINCIISNNTAGENTSGGGLDNEGQMTLINTVVTGNRATVNGGGILNGATNTGNFLHITDSTISNNVANTGVDTTGDGGGIFKDGNPGMTITRSTISGNSALNSHPTSEAQGNGGGIWSDGQVIMDSCTVSGNSAARNFGGVRVPHNFSDSTVTNSTIVNNTAATGGGIGRDNCGLSCRVLSIGNTIVANNTAGTEPDIRNRTGNSHTTPVTSIGYNLIGVTEGVYITLASSDTVGVNPILGPLQNNGGPTATHALQPGSPAIDQGKNLGGMIDQRGLQRPFDNPSVPNAAGGDGSDIGAFEDQPPNTQPGNDITPRSPADDARCTFHSVSQGGYTTFIPIEPPSSAGIPPQGYTILDDAPAYDITTTATFTPPIIVSITIASITSPTEFARVRILHGENGQLVDRTILAPDSPPPDFGTRTVYARVDSLSPFVVALAPASAQLLNVSTRLRVQTGDNALIGGFIISGNTSKKVLVRAIGPSLTEFGIDGALVDPVLELNGPVGFTPITNNDWRDTQQVEIEATGIPPSDNLESAIVMTLAPGAYTAVVRGQNGGTGVGLVEAYDLESAVDATLANISTRGFVEAGENVMIGGVIAGPSGNATGQMLVRAIGPSLLAFEVTNALEDPSLELRDGSGALIASNDDWRETQQTAIEATGIPPSHNKESAILSTLAPGNYTAIVRGIGDTTGVGLVEVYNLN